MQTSGTYPPGAEGDPEVSGLEYYFFLANPPLGAWTLAVSETQVRATDSVVLATVLVDSPIRAALLGGEIEVRPNQSFPISALVTDGTAFLTDYSATAEVYKSGDPTWGHLSASLTDDGSGADAEAGDGLRSANISIGETGAFEIRVVCTGVTVTGRQFRRVLLTSVDVLPETLQINSDGFGSNCLDTDSNGKVDSLDVTVGVTVLTEGEYQIRVLLESADGVTVPEVTRIALPVGPGTVAVRFPQAALLALAGGRAANSYDPGSDRRRDHRGQCHDRGPPFGSRHGYGLRHRGPRSPRGALERRSNFGFRLRF